MCLHHAAVPPDKLKTGWALFKTFNIMQSFSNISFTMCWNLEEISSDNHILRKVFNRIPSCYWTTEPFIANFDTITCFQSTPFPCTMIQMCFWSLPQPSSLYSLCPKKFYWYEIQNKRIFKKKIVYKVTHYIYCLCTVFNSLYVKRICFNALKIIRIRAAIS